MGETSGHSGASKNDVALSGISQVMERINGSI